MLFSDALILPVWQLQIHQMMTSLIRSHTEYLIRTYHILVFIFQSKLTKTLAWVAGFNTI